MDIRLLWKNCEVHNLYKYTLTIELAKKKKYFFYKIMISRNLQNERETKICRGRKKNYWNDKLMENI
jgi:hypothetical protein